MELFRRLVIPMPRGEKRPWPRQQTGQRPDINRRLRWQMEERLA